LDVEKIPVDIKLSRIFIKMEDWMSLILSSLRRQTLDVACATRIFSESLYKTIWLGRSLSTRPAGCSEKCAKFRPKEPCCKKNDIADDTDVVTRPMYFWHPLNVYNNDSIWYQRNPDRHFSEVADCQPPKKTEEDIDPSSSNFDSDSTSGDSSD
jgi:hypothetical protein